ncbi:MULTISPECIES: DUF4956 domain-containing protein [Tissierellales]|jgi:uncharacterized membrane protein YhiD involved in acid resistance|uniref:DUF4956 domain-containing protein n=1 Tax=Acidilutibacter cellobiosedens TaxID=2507161 RepID=A0A410QG02_9FIRM|nr:MULTISPECIES: DUF4956 domain-containing protein [Tissierellales]MBE6082239.1 DUF4956 domain-containing protein [Tissierellaceae bacterium]QAT62754.1 DUF4956 domain-containing protein [Acidilutibacter cellobiosedens]SCL95389.1 putative Mg(2+) transport ATPase [Sporanaerobacter sp. PP17-6a]
MTFNDIFKSSFLEKVSSFSALDMVIALGLAFVLGLFIFYVYKKTFIGVMYSASFGVSLIAMTLITTFIILAVTSNVVLSLGMVGALSIVRFRAAIKEPLDITFLFWSISVGIVIGAGLIPLAVFGSIFIGIVMVIFINRKSTDDPYILLINCADDNGEQLVKNAVELSVKKYMIRSKTVSPKGIELTIEVRLKNMTTDFVNNIAKIEGVENAVLVSYNGEYMS